MQERLALVSRDGRYHTDALSRPLYGRRFLSVSPFSEGASAVSDDSGAYHIGYGGEPLYSARFLGSYPFSEGLAAVRDGSGWFHIGKDGEPAYPERFGWCGSFREGMCAVRRDDGRYSFLDRKFVAVGDCLWAGDFSEGMAPVISEEGAYHVRRDGAPAYRRRFLGCGDFHEGKAPVRDGGGWFRIDASGEPTDAGRFGSIVYKGSGEWRAVRGREALLLTAEGENHLMALPDRSSSALPADAWWFGDISSRPWDSCVLVMRHSVRDRFCRADFHCHSPHLNAQGEPLARAAGRAVRKALKGPLKVYSSPVERCMETARFISEECGGPEPVPSEVLGEPGTPFVSDTEVIDMTWKSYPVSEITFGDLAGGSTPGLYPPEKNAELLLEALRPKLERDGLLTVCVTHDLYLMRAAGYLAGRFPEDTWADFCEGFMIIRRGEEEYFVWHGQEHPVPKEFPRKGIDVSPVHEPRVVPSSSGSYELGEGMRYDGGFILGPGGRRIAGPFAWAGSFSEGACAVRMPDGSFGHVRDDGVRPYRFRFDDAGPFSGSTAPVARDGKGWTYISDAGEVLIDRWLLECRPFSEGYAAVRDERGWFHIDMHGRELYPQRYAEAGDFGNGEALCMETGGALYLVGPNKARALLCQR